MVELSELEREGLIQRFEYTYELAVKTLQDFLRFKGYADIAGLNPVLILSFLDGYLVDEAGWRKMKKARELSSYTYNSNEAEAIAEAVIAIYFPLLDYLEKRLEGEFTGGQVTPFS